MYLQYLGIWVTLQRLFRSYLHFLIQDNKKPKVQGVMVMTQLGLLSNLLSASLDHQMAQKVYAKCKY